MKIAVLGTDAVGTHLAGRLAHAGADVTLATSGAAVDALRVHGLTLQAGETSLHARIPAVTETNSLGPQDAVIVCDPSAPLPEIIAPLLGLDTVVGFATDGIPWWYFHGHGGRFNGRRLARLDPGDAIWQAVGPQRALGLVLHGAGQLVEPGIVSVHPHTSYAELGMADGSHPAIAQELVTLLTASGLPTRLVADIRAAIWSKLLYKLCTGPLCALTLSTQQANTLAAPAFRDAARQVIQEGAAIAQAMGHVVPVDLDHMTAVAAITHAPAIAQELESAHPIDIAAVYDAPLEIARMSGVATPMLDLLVGLLKSRARAAASASG